jgi:hypothetical protein
VGSNGSAELGEHDLAGDPAVRGDPQSQAGAVIKPGEDLAVGPGTALGSGEPVVGEVGLPALVGLLGGEADVGRLRLLLRLGDHQAVGGQMSGNGRPGDPDAVMVLEVPADGVGA